MIKEGSPWEPPESPLETQTELSRFPWNLETVIINCGAPLLHQVISEYFGEVAVRHSFSNGSDGNSTEMEKREVDGTRSSSRLRSAEQTVALRYFTKLYQNILVK